MSKPAAHAQRKHHQNSSNNPPSGAHHFTDDVPRIARNPQTDLKPLDPSAGADAFASPRLLGPVRVGQATNALSPPCETICEKLSRKHLPLHATCSLLRRHTSMPQAPQFANKALAAERRCHAAARPHDHPTPCLRAILRDAKPVTHTGSGDCGKSSNARNCLLAHTRTRNSKPAPVPALPRPSAPLTIITPVDLALELLDVLGRAALLPLGLAVVQGGETQTAAQAVLHGLLLETVSDAWSGRR